MNKFAEIQELVLRLFAKGGIFPPPPSPINQKYPGIKPLASFLDMVVLVPVQILSCFTFGDQNDNDDVALRIYSSCLNRRIKWDWISGINEMSKNVENIFIYTVKPAYNCITPRIQRYLVTAT